MFIKKAKTNYPHLKKLLQKSRNISDIGLGSLELNNILNAVKKSLELQKKFSGFGNLFSYPSAISVEAYKKLSHLSPNNLGNWSIPKATPPNPAAEIERDLISKMSQLFSGTSSLEGYVTSGSTEANIFSVWIGRKYMVSKKVKVTDVALLINSLSHYSLVKAADLTGIRSEYLPINSSSWSFDIGSFSEYLSKLYRRGFRGFLLPITYGYTQTGTSDDLSLIINEIRQFTKTHKNAHFFVFIDAAFLGLVKPFTKNWKSPFEFSEVKTITTDLHKFGFTPISSGVILYKKELRKFIEKNIDYLSQKDNTLLGSRNGLASISAWVSTMSLGKRGFKKLIKYNLSLKEKFIDKCREVLGNRIIVSTDDFSLGCGIILTSGSLDNKTQEVENLFNVKFRKTTVVEKMGTKKIWVAKAFFLKTPDNFLLRFKNWKMFW